MSESGKQPSHPTDSTLLGGHSELPGLYTSHRASTSATHPAAAEVTIYENVFQQPMALPHAGTDGALRRDFPLENSEPVAHFPDPFNYMHVGASPSQPPSSRCHTSENTFLESEVYTENPAQYLNYHASAKAAFSVPGEPGFQNQNDLWTEYISNFMHAPSHSRS